jgi:peptidoglycan L-alanyl-D-glutamate endopeptidase CwlK
MYELSKKSLERLATCNVLLQEICHEVIRETNFYVLCGHRTEQEQQEAFRTGRSKLQWPDSKHNSNPSNAIDVAPNPLDWNDIDSFRKLAGVFKRVAAERGVRIVWGGDWDGFKDYPHIELL